jgi:hypothetical protein
VGAGFVAGRAEREKLMDIVERIRREASKQDMLVCEDMLQAVDEIERLRAALEPFAVIGRKIAHAVGDTKSFPPGASARYLKLEPLVVQNFVDAAKCVDGEIV